MDRDFNARSRLVDAVSTYVTAESISMGWSPALSHCFDAIPFELVKQLEASREPNAPTLSDITAKVDEFFVVRKDCRYNGFQDLEKDLHFDDLLLSSPFCPLIFQEDKF